MNGMTMLSPGANVRLWRPQRSTTPARACGITRTVRAARNSANTTSTTATIRPAISCLLLLCHERRRAPDLHDMHPGARLDHDVVVVAASGPDLPVDPHAPDALVVGDALEHDRAAADQRRGPGADLRRHRQVPAR